MAAISATQAIRTITPPSSIHGRGESWEFAVQDDNENGVHNHQPYGSQYAGKPFSDASRHMANGSNTNAGAVANPTYTTKSVPESDYLAPARVNDLNRKLSDTSQRSEADSLLDLYKSAPTKRAAPTGVENGGKRKQTNGFGKPTGHEEDAWIHRDKLAQIESRELEEAGFKVPSASRSVSRSASRSVSRSASRSHSNSVDKRHEAREVEDFHDADVFRRDEIMQHTLPEDALDESMEDEDVDMMDWELRTPEEVAAEQWEMSSPVAKPPPRQPGSRLPMMRLGAQSSSPLDRDSPIAKSRRTNGSFGGSAIPEPRSRSRSVGSHTLLDSDENARPHTPTRSSAQSSEKGSPLKNQKALPKAPGPNGTRKPSATRSNPAIKPRQVSQPKPDSSPKRPGTSSGIPRPSTSHRPEGEAPWIASMYKPDPRLPPDQQMLPTHAKRMAQEQWEKEGKTGTVYDKEFRLLNTEAFPEAKILPKEIPQEVNDVEEKTVTTELSPKWPLQQLQPSPMSPLSQIGSNRSQTSLHRPGTAGTEHGGYKTIPTIHSPQTQSRPISAQVPVQTIRLPEPKEPTKPEKSKSCGCCIVM